MTAPRRTVEFLDLVGQHDRLHDQLDVAWKAVLASGYFVGGPEVAAFEAEFAAYCGAAHCVGVANGTDALELILTGLGIGPGDEVIVPANTFVATAEAVCTVGARPRFVDVAPDTLLIDPDLAAAAVTPRTAAIIAVHLFGQMADMPALRAVADRHGLALVEDAAQAHGARFAGVRAGSAGAAAAFSFYPGKNLGALGDGGAVVTGDPALASRIRRLADHGRSPVDRHRHEVSGRNSRLDSLQAAVLRVKLSGLDDANRARAAVMRRYRTNLPVWCVPVTVAPAAQPVHHLAVVQVPDRAAVTAALDAAGIGWGVHYPVPCNRQPAFATYGERLPVVEAAADRILSLPIHPTLDHFQIDLVCDTVRGAQW
ncbi:DegT/DnrJ/EryC1/StrS family aminotransferase [Pseudonocardia acidicola]|uniref:Aminotransferase class V-fold PLP-dependent enzyme n=1 Tax=Pseudonocardia acidicola TaxID=2724939 RepID=A0ABX1SHL8_9PSEU|nr:DegT/DnrJ/EryC1/StrS family aminotransferase [Pseudonocardia acidicola]NMI00268.1 aminotransferase class V-fold PLP-dependent enzyme [Pseudonocardia acidicola]